MGRGYIFAVTLAALGAVFLQGCGKAAPPPAPAFVQTTITAAAAKGTSVVQVATNLGFVVNSKVTITDPVTKKSEVNGIKGFGSIILMAPLQNDYGVSSTVTMLIADGGKASLASVTTAANVVSMVRPAYIVPGVGNTLTLTGSAVAGDKLSFGSAGCAANETTALTPVTFVDANTSTVAVPNLTVANYFICYQQVGRTDIVQQTAIDPVSNVSIVVHVQVAAGATEITGISPTTAVTGTKVTYTLAPAAGATLSNYKAALTKLGQPCPWVSLLASWQPIASNTVDFTVGALGDYEVCICNAGSSTPQKQTNQKITVTAARLYAVMEDDAEDNTKPGNSSLTNIVMGAGGLMLVAFVALGVKKATSRGRSVMRYANEEQNLEEPIE